MKKVQDHYFRRAKKEGFPARSVYKLQEAQKSYRFLHQGHAVLDLGAAPGSWTKYAAKLVGRQGLVVAVDIQPLAPSGDNVIFLQEDIFTLESEELKALCPAFDVVLSDVAPKTTGRRDVDHLRSVAMAEAALELAIQILRPGGTFFCKVFQGSDFPIFRSRCTKSFQTLRVFKPRSSRPESVEVFLLGFETKGLIKE